MHEINQEELEKILEEKKPKIVIVDFSATWCGPCKSLAKILDSKVVPKIKDMDDVGGYKIDIDKNQDLANALNIRGVPTMMFWVDGKKAVFETERGQEDRIVGFDPNVDKTIFAFIDFLKEQGI